MAVETWRRNRAVLSDNNTELLQLGTHQVCGTIGSRGVDKERDEGFVGQRLGGWVCGLHSIVGGCSTERRSEPCPVRIYVVCGLTFPGTDCSVIVASASWVTK